MKSQERTWVPVPLFSQKRSEMNASGQKALAKLSPSPPRRWFGIGVLALLGTLLIYFGVSGLSFDALDLVAIAAGALILFLAFRMRTSTQSFLVLNAGGLYTNDGITVAEIANISKIDRGLFALKPSNGFLVILKRPMRGSWHPGLWWRLGTRIGVGGVTSPAEGKLMAENLTRLIQNLSSGDDG